MRAEGYDRPPTARPQFAAQRADAGQREVASYAVVSASLNLDFTSPRYTEARLPTITIREGNPFKVYITDDLDLPAYSAPYERTAYGTPSQTR